MNLKNYSSMFGVLPLVLVLICVLDSLAATSSPVRDLGIVKKPGVSDAIFDEAVDLADLQKGAANFLLQSVEKCRALAAKKGKSPQSIGSMGGRWLEFALLVALKENKLTPAYWQAEFKEVPNAFNDVLLWSKESGPIVLSCKTTLRERYKQADAEALPAGKCYPNAKLYLVCLEDDANHLARVRKKIKDGELMALQFIYAADNADELFAFLKTQTLVAPPDNALRSGKVVGCFAAPAGGPLGNIA